MIDEILERTGIITGSASDSAAEAVRAIAVIADMSPDQPVDMVRRTARPEKWSKQALIHLLR